MKTLQFFANIVVFFTACAMVSASEVSTNFAQWMPNFASSDQNQRRDAQQNWQNLCRQQGHVPAVQKEIIAVSVEQLAKNNPVDTSVWIIRQLGTVGDATAVPALTRSLASNEVRVRDEAARALANIPGREAEDALKAVGTIAAAQLAKDALTARAVKADLPKDNAVETVLPMAVPYLPFTATADIAAFMEGYKRLSDMEKAQVLSNLADRTLRVRVSFQQRRLAGEVRPGAGLAGTGQGPAGGARRTSPYIPLALAAVQSSDETLRNAGILAVGALGGEEQVPFLLEYARTGANRDLAKLALARMSGQRIDAVLLENLKTEQDAEKFSILADILNRRFNMEMRPFLLERAKAPGTPNRQQLLQWAESTSTKGDIPEFVAVWTLITDRGEKDRAEQNIARLAAGDASGVLQALGDHWDTPEGMSLLGRIGDADTLARIRQGKNAVHAFRTWTNAVVADDLIKAVNDEELTDEERRLALRAFIRVMSLPNNQIGIRINDVQKVNRLIVAYELAEGSNEKRYALERIGQIRTLESLRFVLKYIDDPELRERACASVLDLAHDTNFRNSSRAEFNAALDKVLSVLDGIPNENQRNNFRNRANGYKAGQ